MRRLKSTGHTARFVRSVSVVAVVIVLLNGPLSSAQKIPSRDFSIEVSPSPLVATVKPGVTSTLDLKIHNASVNTEDLRIEARDFRMADNNTITLAQSPSSELTKWVSFSQPHVTMTAGQWMTQHVSISLPDSAGFSQSFAIIISRPDTEPPAAEQGRILKGSVAVFALINVDKPGASRTLELTSFTADSSLYEFLPVTLNLTLKNTGNSIVQPYGSFYIQRGDDAARPLDVQPVNDALSYILPGTSRTFTARWDDGFPYTDTSGTKPRLRWDNRSLDQFRFGAYTAKVVAAYNDGRRDVPLTHSLSFWVVPWKLLLLVLVVATIIGIGLWSIGRRLAQFAPLAALRRRLSGR